MLSAIEFDASGRDPSGYLQCPACGYPHKREACENPACDANPDIPEATKAARREAAAKRQAQEDQWRKDRELRDRAWPARRVESYVDAAATIGGIAADVKARQSAFLAARGLSWEEARALPAAEKEALKADWLAWDKANPPAAV